MVAKRDDKVSLTGGWDAWDTMSYFYNAIRGPGASPMKEI